MFKLRVLFAALAVIAAGGLVNCSKMKANKSIPGGGPDIMVERPLVETAQEKADREYREKIDAHTNVQVALEEMSKNTFGEELCSTDEVRAITEKNLPVKGQDTEVVNPIDRIKNKDASEDAVRIAANLLALDLQKMQNNYCIVNIGADLAKFALSDFLLVGSQAIDITSSEQYDNQNKKAAHLVNSIKPVVDAARIRVFQANADDYKKMRDYVEGMIEINNRKIEVLRKLDQCEEATPLEACRPLDRITGKANVITITKIMAAEATLEETQLKGDNDPAVVEKLLKLSNANTALKARLKTANFLIGKHYELAGDKDELKRLKCLVAPAAGCDADDLSEEGTKDDSDLDTQAGYAKAIDVDENQAVVDQYESEEAKIEAQRAEILAKCVKRVKVSCIENSGGDLVEIISCDKNSECPVSEQEKILNGIPSDMK